MLKQFATIISYLTHPLWLPSMATVLVLGKPWWNNILPFSLEISTLLPPYTYIIYVVISSVLLPLVTFQYLLVRNKINSLQMRTSKERIIPSLVLLLIYLINIILFLTVFEHALLAFVFILASYVTLINLIAVAAFKFKISLHTSSISSFAVICAMLYQAHYIDILTLISIATLSIVVGFARWQLKAHSITQIIGGYLLGFSTLFLYCLR